MSGTPRGLRIGTTDKKPWNRQDAGGRPARTSRTGRDGRTNKTRIIR